MLPIPISSLHISHPCKNVLELWQCPVKRTSIFALCLCFSTPCYSLSMEQLLVCHLHNKNSLILIFSGIFSMALFFHLDDKGGTWTKEENFRLSSDLIIISKKMAGTEKHIKMCLWFYS